MPWKADPKGCARVDGTLYKDATPCASITSWTIFVPRPVPPSFRLITRLVKRLSRQSSPAVRRRKSSSSEEVNRWAGLATLAEISYAWSWLSHWPDCVR